MIKFYIVYSFVRALSLLPLWLLYIISYFLYVLVYYVVGYRREVVQNNLKLAFPEKTDTEIKGIEKKFYKHFGDIVVDSIKEMDFSKMALRKHMVIKNPELIDSYLKEDKTVVVITSHYANWELPNKILPLYYDSRVFTAYKSFSSKTFEKLILRKRERYGIKMAPMKQILRYIIKYKGEPSINYMATDQSPTMQEAEHWTTFLGQDVPFYNGAEKITKNIENSAVVYCDIQKVKRGYYEAELIEISNNPQNEDKGFITERNVRILEEIIKEKPELWLWTHNRFKHRRNAS